MSSTPPVDPPQAETRAPGATRTGPPSGTDFPFGRFRLLERLGAGGMGIVHRAWDPKLGRHVALKRLRVDGDSGIEVARFLREARVAARLRHPGIVQVHDSLEVDGAPAIVMEWVQGCTLETWLAGNPAVGEESLRRRVGLLLGIAEAVGHAHGEGVIHRDLKPANVLIDDQGRPRVADFGLARRLPFAGGMESAPAAALTEAATVLGTPAYMSPEQARGESDGIGPRSDVWSLGVMLYEMITGRPPFQRENGWRTLEAVAREEVTPPSATTPRVSPPLEAICLRALHRDPERRYRDGKAFADDLRRWLVGESVQAGPGGREYRARVWIQTRRPALAGALVVAMAIVGLTVWGIAGSGRRMQEALQVEAAESVTSFEDRVRSIEMTVDARRDLARQPLALLDRWIAEGPDAGVGHAWRGQVRLLLGDEAGAAADFEQACRRSPERWEPWWVRGFWRMEQYLSLRGLSAFRMTETGVESDPARAESGEEAGLRVSALADLGRMVRCSAAGAAGNDERLKMAQALAALGQGDAAGYREALTRLEGLNLPRSHRIRGRALHQLGRFEEAEEAYTRVLERWPEDADAWRSRAVSRNVAGVLAAQRGTEPQALLERAEADFGEAIRCEPDESAAYLGRANLRTWRVKVRIDRAEDPTGALQEAEEDLFEAGRRGAPEWRVVRLQGQLLLLAAEWDRIQHRSARTHIERAIEEFERAARSGPEPGIDRLLQSRAYVALAADEIAARQDPRATFDKALAAVDEACALLPTRGEPLAERGEMRFSMAIAAVLFGRDPVPFLGPAMEDLAAALKIRPGAVKTLRIRARARALRARYEDRERADLHREVRASLEDLDAVLAVLPSDADLLQDRAQMCLRLGELEASFGGDPRPHYRSGVTAIERLEGAPVRQPGPLLATLGALRWRLAQAEAVRGGDPGAGWTRAVADLLTARGRFGFETGHTLGRLYRTLGRWGEAAGEFERFGGTRGGSPEVGRVLAEECRALDWAGGRGWAAAWRRGDEALAGGDPAAAWREYETAAAGLFEDVGGLPEAERDPRQRPTPLRVASTAVSLGLARAAAVLAHGGEASGEPARASDPAAREQWLDRMLEHLQDACEQGAEIAMWGDDPVFAPFAEDPRFRNLRRR